MIFNFIFAVLCGLVIGIERKLKGKAAGLKTIVLITIGSMLFTEIALLFQSGDPLRVIGQIVTGVGFLGAGCIFHNQDKTSGLTTAAIVWVTAALGVLCGIGQGSIAFILSILITGLILLIGWIETKLLPK